MLLDETTAGNPSGGSLIGEVAHLDQNVAYYEVVQGGYYWGSHDGFEEIMDGEPKTKRPSHELRRCKASIIGNQCGRRRAAIQLSLFDY